MTKKSYIDYHLFSIQLEDMMIQTTFPSKEKQKYKYWFFPPLLLLLYTSKQEFQLFCSFISYPYFKKPIFLFLLWFQCKILRYFWQKEKKYVLGFKVLKSHLIGLFIYEDKHTLTCWCFHNWKHITFNYLYVFPKKLSHENARRICRKQANSSRNRLNIATCEDVNRFVKEIMRVLKESKTQRELVVRRMVTKKYTLD